VLRAQGSFKKFGSCPPHQINLGADPLTELGGNKKIENGPEKSSTTSYCPAKLDANRRAKSGGNLRNEKGKAHLFIIEVETASLRIQTKTGVGRKKDLGKWMNSKGVSD